jgi:hypothetical protein
MDGLASVQTVMQSVLVAIAGVSLIIGACMEYGYRRRKPSSKALPMRVYTTAPIEATVQATDV